LSLFSFFFFYSTASNRYLPSFPTRRSSDLDVGPCGRLYFDKSSPGVIRIGGHTGGVEENAYRIAIEAVLYEHVIVGRNEKIVARSEEHTSELQSRFDLVCRLLLEKKKKIMT